MALFSVFLIVLAVSLYLLPDEEKMAVSDTTLVPGKTTSQASPIVDPDGALKNEPSGRVSSAGQAALAPVSDAGASETEPYVSYPNALLELLAIDMDDLLANRDAFKNSIIHVEWMDRVNMILKNLNPEKRAAIIANHASLLYIKDKLNEAYLSGKIDHATFIKALADLMRWHQKTYEDMLTRAEYETLFEVSPEETEDMIGALLSNAPEYSFILNQELPVEEVAKQVQGYKLEEVNSHFKQMMLVRDNIGKKISAGELTIEQAREALYQSQMAFIAKCKEVLTIDEINTIFGSLHALETGGTQTPAVEGDDDINEFGFQILNPTTSIDDVRDKIGKDKVEDIRFFYQERDAERQELISRLDAGEITSEELENISNELDAAFEENCRSILTDEEYKLLFDVSQGMEAGADADSETLKKLTEQELTQEKTADEKKAE